MPTPPFQNWNLNLRRSYVHRVLAFPTSAACFRYFYWHATCWIDSPTVGNLPNHIYNRIRSHVRPDLGPGGPLVHLYEFGGPQRYYDPDGFSFPRDVRLLLAFPHLEEDIFEEAILRKWMDKVVIPAIGGSLPPGTLQDFNHTSVQMIGLNSQANRVEGMKDVPDTCLDFYLQPDQLQSAWDNIRRKTETPGFEEFRGVCPVILANYSPLRFNEGSPQEAFQKLLHNWNSTMDIQCILPGGFYIDFVTEGDIDITGR